MAEKRTKALPADLAERLRVFVDNLARERGVVGAGKALGISAGMVSDVRSGKRGAGFRTALAIATHVGRPIEELLGTSAPVTAKRLKLVAKAVPGLPVDAVRALPLYVEADPRAQRAYDRMTASADLTYEQAVRHLLACIDAARLGVLE